MKKDCIAVDAIDPIDSFHRKMSGIEGLIVCHSWCPREPGYAPGTARHPLKVAHCTTPGGTICGQDVGMVSATSPPFCRAWPKLLLWSLCFVPRSRLISKPLPGLCTCFLGNLTLPVYCLRLLCFISCYLICDSEPTKNSFQLRCPPHAISS